MEHFPEFVANHLFLFTLLVALLALLAWNLFGHAVTGVTLVIPMETTSLINHENAVVIDVRSEADFRTGHILNALNFPAADMMQRLDDLKKYSKRTIILYCNNGSDSARLCRMLRQQGFDKVNCLKGGLYAWRNANLPLARVESAETSS